MLVSGSLNGTEGGIGTNGAVLFANDADKQSPVGTAIMGIILGALPVAIVWQLCTNRYPLLHPARMGLGEWAIMAGVLVFVVIGTMHGGAWGGDERFKAWWMWTIPA